MKDRRRTLVLDADVEIVVDRSSAYPIEYSIVLVARRGGNWHTVRLFDNSHAPNEHHEHAYVGSEKQPPGIRRCTAEAAISEALLRLRIEWADIVARWDETR